MRARTSTGRNELKCETDLFDEQLDRCERMLAYAVERGKEVPDETLNQILAGRSVARSEWSSDTAKGIVRAAAALSNVIEPVTPENLRACAEHGSGRRQMRAFAICIWVMGPPLLTFAVANFCVAKLCEATQTQMHTAQELAVKLGSELSEPDQSDETKRQTVKKLAPNLTRATIVEDLSQFAIAIRGTQSLAERLSWFIMRPRRIDSGESTAVEFELDPALNDLAVETTRAIQRYQRVRHYAQTVQSDASILYGAVLNCLLPTMYSILGALAYLIRRYQKQLRHRRLAPGDGHTAHFVIAAIGGFVVGLFNVNVAHLSISPPPDLTVISPLATAFLVGYAVDVFYSGLDTLIDRFRQRSAESSLSATGVAQAKI